MSLSSGDWVSSSGINRLSAGEAYNRVFFVTWSDEHRDETVEAIADLLRSKD